MDTKKKTGMAYLLELAGKYKLHLALSAFFGVLSALCSFIPYVMVYRTLLFLFDSAADVSAALRYGSRHCGEIRIFYHLRRFLASGCV